MSRFQTLKVKDVRPTIREAVVVTLEPENPEAFAYAPGQYLTFRREFDGVELRRSYSICAGPEEPLMVGIKRVEGGAFSTWANETLKPGDTVEAMPPMGSFTTDIAPGEDRHYLGFAGGSGITPVLSLMKHTLAQEPDSQFTLVYANRGTQTIMFREELEDLKNRHMGRVNVIHILEQDAQEIDLFTGRVDQEKCAQLFERWIDVGSVDTAFICGPEPMMLAIAEALRAHGLDDDQIKFELFASGQPGRAPQKVRAAAEKAGAGQVAVSVTLDGASRSFEMPRDQAVLDAALAADMDAPYACKAGVCSTCRCRVLEGEVEMAANHALEDYEVRAGYILSCQAFPLSDKLVVSYDE